MGRISPLLSVLLQVSAGMYKSNKRTRNKMLAVFLREWPFAIAADPVGIE